MSGEVPPVPEHVWPDADDVARFEHQFGIVYCRRCGRLLTNHSGIRRDVKPCRVVRIRPRGTL